MIQGILCFVVAAVVALGSLRIAYWDGQKTTRDQTAVIIFDDDHQFERKVSYIVITCSIVTVAPPHTVACAVVLK